MAQRYPQTYGVNRGGEVSVVTAIRSSRDELVLTLLPIRSAISLRASLAASTTPHAANEPAGPPSALPNHSLPA